MSRLLMYPFAGAACGALTAVVIVPAIGGNSEESFGMTVVVGTFLAGAGAVAGAILGAAELFVTSMDRARIVSEQDAPKTEV